MQGSVLVSLRCFLGRSSLGKAGVGMPVWEVEKGGAGGRGKVEWVVGGKAHGWTGPGREFLGSGT